MSNDESKVCGSHKNVWLREKTCGFRDIGKLVTFNFSHFTFFPSFPWQPNGPYEGAG